MAKPSLSLQKAFKVVEPILELEAPFNIVAMWLFVPRLDNEHETGTVIDASLTMLSALVSFKIKIAINMKIQLN